MVFPSITLIQGCVIHAGAGEDVTAVTRASGTHRHNEGFSRLSRRSSFIKSGICFACETTTSLY